MSGADKGFSQYYGFWAIFCTTPLILLLSGFLYDFYLQATSSPDQYCSKPSAETRKRVVRLVERHTDSLKLRYDSAWILVFVMVVLFLAWVFNVVGTQSSRPVTTFGHDVFDASAHVRAFYVTRAYIFFVFVLVYAPAVFLALHVTASMISTLRLLCRLNVLNVNVFHADNCGGTSQFGNINLLILGVYGSFFTVLWAMYLTHRHAYPVMLASLVACSVLAVVQSIAAVYHIHKAIAEKKREYMDVVTTRLNEHLAPSLKGEKFPNDLLAFRNHLQGIHTFPYAGAALVAVNIIRFAPAAIAVLGFFKRH